MKAQRVLIYCEIIDHGLEVGVQAACRGEYARGARAMDYIHNLPGAWTNGLREELNFLDMNRGRQSDKPNPWVKRLEDDMLREPEVAAVVKGVRPDRIDWMTVIKALGGARTEEAKMSGKVGRDVVYAELLRDCILMARVCLWGSHGGVAIDALNHARRLPRIIGRNDPVMEEEYLGRDCERLRQVQERMAENRESSWAQLRKSLRDEG